MKTRYFLFLLIFILTVGCGFQKNTMPDFCQGNERYGKLPADGKPYCGPTSVSNILIYLDKQGFSDIVNEENNYNNAQYELIKTLGSKEYMNTKLKVGTEPIDIIKGLEKYIKEKGYQVSIAWKGWTNGEEYSRGKIPDSKWIFDNLSNDYNVILQIGWYKQKGDLYERLSGHYVTVAGTKENKLVIHDPAIRSGIKPSKDICTLHQIQEGVLSSFEEYGPKDAKGYLVLNGINLKEGANVAIVDGALVFKLFK